jgi:hypothetical protein
MREPIAHPGDVLPGDVRLMSPNIGTDRFDRLTGLNQSNANSVENEAVAERAALEVAFDRRQRLRDVFEPLIVTSTHSGIASLSASSRTPRRRLSAGATSTRVPSIRLSSRSSAPSATRLVRGARSTSKSVSLSGRSSPRATLPKTLRFDAPKWAAAATSGFRRCRNHRPRGVSGRPGRASGSGSSSSVRWCPVAATSRRNVLKEGSRLPDS